MSVALAYVPAHTRVPWTILSFVLRVETNDLVPQLERLAQDFQRLQQDLVPLNDQLDILAAQVVPLLEEARAFQATLAPVWDDTYNLCGRASCNGRCVICREGEFLDEVDEGEKYCRRGRR